MTLCSGYDAHITDEWSLIHVFNSLVLAEAYMRNWSRQSLVNKLSPFRRQAKIRANAELLTEYFSRIVIETESYSFKNIRKFRKVMAILCRLQWVNISNNPIIVSPPCYFNVRLALLRWVNLNLDYQSDGYQYSPQRTQSNEIVDFRINWPIRRFVQNSIQLKNIIIWNQSLF